MSKEIFWSKKFKQDYKRLVKSGKPTVIEELLNVVENLANNEKMPEKYQDHALKGNWNGYRECHIRPDILLLHYKCQKIT